MKMEKPVVEFIKISDIVITTSQGASSTDCYTNSSRMATCLTNNTWMYDNLGGTN